MAAMSGRTLLVRGLPPALGVVEQRELLARFGATDVRPMHPLGRMVRQPPLGWHAGEAHERTGAGRGPGSGGLC
jgi:hypothetical protein